MKHQKTATALPGFLAEGGDMGRAIAAKDWSKTALGPIDAWPQALRHHLGLLLLSNEPLALAWGPHHILLYNDSYRMLCGDRHPRVLGHDFRRCKPPGWPGLDAAFERAAAGEASCVENQRLFFDHHGYPEETFFTFSFSPVPDEETRRVAGVFITVSSQTAKVLYIRRRRALRALASRNGEAHTVESGLQLAATTLAPFDLDLPFLLLYRTREGSTQLVAHAGFNDDHLGHNVPPPVAEGAIWPFESTAGSSAPFEVLIGDRLGTVSVGPYPELPQRAFILPITPPGYSGPAAFAVAGVSPRLTLNDSYLGFYELLGVGLTAFLAYTEDREAEEARAKAKLEAYWEHFRQMAAVVQKSEELFRTLADQVPVMVFMTAPDNATYWNKFWLEYTGLTETESHDKGWRVAAHPEDVDEAIAVYNAAVTRRQTATHEFRLRRHDGVYRWFQFTVAPRYASNGSYSGYSGIAIDVTERRETATLLESLVRERTAELQQSNEDLQQFAHVTSHDLKEPVRKVKTFAGMLHDDPGNKLTERSQTYLKRIRNATDRMLTMINGVLSYSTLSSSEPEWQPVPLEELLASIREDLEVPIRQKGATVVSGRLPVLQGSPVLLYQLFFNLVNNALKFTHEGVAPRISITSHHDRLPGWTRIEVRDNGIGFEPGYAEHIFETFTRLHSKDKYEGTGLGLALCRKIVQRHGGHISAQGVPGEGAVFVIVLPLKEA
ncbi:sensor histidine kinase [Flaviaesturariibacter aridisoli]|uniref:histidine kinase n=1 Tax=Flaviaesturariibacter aridisoli TaxID=2545761 RepID=A0A4R4E4F7_9BACT|nr:ATP-binding protein [Flaviaesturariibacter aridisoli]TCZ71823.1 PAS domain S-box protein [Flaviaesturariibacter aridisoli]